MNKLKTILTAALLSFASFTWMSSASAVGISAFGVGIGESAFMGSGKETETGSGADTTTATITEEDGAFTDQVTAVFIEISAADNVSVGLEYWPADLATPENTNVQGASTNTVKASFENHIQLYGLVGLPFGFYAKAGIARVDILTEESLATGGAYNDEDTMGYTLGLGYQKDLDNDIFVRAEVSAFQYDDVSAGNTADTTKQVEVTDMYGATATIRFGKSF